MALNIAFWLLRQHCCLHHNSERSSLSEILFERGSRVRWFQLGLGRFRRRSQATLAKNILHLTWIVLRMTWCCWIVLSLQLWLASICRIGLSRCKRVLIMRLRCRPDSRSTSRANLNWLRLLQVKVVTRRTRQLWVLRLLNVTNSWRWMIHYWIRSSWSQRLQWNIIAIAISSTLFLQWMVRWG